jgi:hypothetical protein
LAAQPLDERGIGGVLSEDRGRRVTVDQADHQEGEDGDPKQQDDQSRKPA